MSNLSNSVFGLAKFVFSAKLEVSTCVTFLRSVFVAYFERSTLTLMFPLKLPNGLGNNWLVFIRETFIQDLFYQSNY